MTDKAAHFIRANLMSPVVSYGLTSKGGARYRLKDGNRFSLSKSEFENLQRIMERTGFSIRHDQPAP